MMEWYFKVLACVVVYILLWKFFFYGFISELVVDQNGGKNKAAVMQHYGMPFKSTKTYWTYCGCKVLYYLAWVYIVILALFVIFKS